MLISFSGIDGAGKSTQIQKLREYLCASGIPITELTFWDNVAMFPRVRAAFSRRVLQSDGNIGTPENPANRRDKNTHNLVLVMGRSILHLFDVVNLRRIVQKAQLENTGVVIFDRYIYDQLAALPMHSSWARALARVLLRVAPKPDLSYILDADPEVARERKPEYPLDFMRKYRSSYLELHRLANLQLISPGSVDDVHQAIVDAFRNCILERESDAQLQSAVVA